MENPDVNGIHYYNSTDHIESNTTGMIDISDNRHNNNNLTVDNSQQRSLMVLRIVSSVVLSASLLMLTFLAVLLNRFKTRKIMRASSPLMLSVTLFGAFFQYVCGFVLMTSTQKPTASCIVSQWLQLIGFALMYGALGLKTWRVSVILLFYKSRQMYTKDKALVIRLLAILGVVILYLVIWTFMSTHGTYQPDELCSFTSWSYLIIYIGKLLLLVWGCVMCYQARFAPTLYNDSIYIGLAMGNHIIWMINFLLSRYYLQTYQSEYWNLLLSFLYIEFTISTTIIVIFFPKFSAIISKTRIVEGTLTDVYGPARIHKLTLIINKTGSVKSISCSPCGPLQDVDGGIEHTETCDVRETRETEYSKEEVNALIELVSKLKSERQYYKTQLKTLITDLRTLKSHSGVNGISWPPTPLVPPTPCVQDNISKENNIYMNGFNPNSYWVANVLSGDNTGTNGALLPQCHDHQQCSSNLLGQSKTGDSLSTIITTVSLSPNLNMAETSLGVNNKEQQHSYADSQVMEPETNNNTSVDVFDDRILYHQPNSTRYNSNNQFPLYVSDHGSKMCCINRTDGPICNTQKSLNKNNSIPQRPNTLTIAKNHSTNCYTKKSHYVFYI